MTPAAPVSTPSPTPPVTGAACPSILGPSVIAPDAAQPGCFHDLGLDRVVAAVCAPVAEHGLEPLFHQLLPSREAVAFRQAVLTDLACDAIGRSARRFTAAMAEVRHQRANAARSPHPIEAQHLRLAALRAYLEAVRTLADALAREDAQSEGLRSWGRWLRRHVDSAAFAELERRASSVHERLASLRFAVRIGDARVQVWRSGVGVDHAAALRERFAKFRHADTTVPVQAARPVPGLNHIETQVLDCVARLHPQAFAALAELVAASADFVAPEVARFDREAHFYLAWLDFIAPLQQAGLSFCCPEIAARDEDQHARDAFDVALARTLTGRGATPVCNDVPIGGAQRILVVTGPNQGGKTTFARMVGQLYWLAALGLSVPAASARLQLCDQVLTHFEREESVTTLRGKLHDDLLRLRGLLESASADSVLVFNEIFASTSLEDALRLGRVMLHRVESLGAVAVFVTFLDALAHEPAGVLSLVATLDPTDPTARTFRVEPRAADGLAWALALAEKHHVTGAWLRQRIAP